MKHALVAAGIVASLAACKSRKAPSPDKQPPAPDDAATAAVTPDAAAGPDADEDAFDEESLRAGKRTGLLTGELPEVATEDLARALIDGNVPWDRFVDPALGLVEMRSAPDLGGLPVTRRCGDGILLALKQHAAEMTATLAQTRLAYELACDNSGLVNGGPLPSALCSIDSPGGDVAHDLVFVPDATRGLRVAGVATSVVGPVDDKVMDELDLALARTGKLCP